MCWYAAHVHIVKIGSRQTLPAVIDMENGIGNGMKTFDIICRCDEQNVTEQVLLITFRLAEFGPELRSQRRKAGKPSSYALRAAE